MNPIFPRLAVFFLVFSVLLVAGRAATFGLDANVPEVAGGQTGNSTTITDNGAIFSANGVGSGSGTYTSLYRVDAKGGDPNPERGYNYNDSVGGNAPPYDQKGGVGTNDLDLSDIPIVTISGQQYLQFLLDINESGNDTLITITELRVYLTANSVLDNHLTIYEPNEANLGTTVGGTSSLGKLVYSLDWNYTTNTALDNSVNIEPKTGSGTSDVDINLPLSLFTPDKGYNGTDDVYFWIKFINNSSGFEEIAIFKGATLTYGQLIPEPGTGLGAMLMAALVAGGVRHRRRAASVC